METVPGTVFGTCTQATQRRHTLLRMDAIGWVRLADVAATRLGALLVRYPGAGAPRLSAAAAPRLNQAPLRG